jgi:hypothetical protein
VTRQLHAAAVTARIDAQVDKVFDGYVPDGTVPPYVVVYFEYRRPTAEERPDASNLVFDSLPFQVTATVHSIGGGDNPALAARSARAIANQVELALLDWTPTVAGRSCSPMRQIGSFTSPPDEQTGVAYQGLVDEYRFHSQPA